MIRSNRMFLMFTTSVLKVGGEQFVANKTCRIRDADGKLQRLGKS